MKKRNEWLARIDGGEFKVQRLQELPSEADKLLDTPERVVNYLQVQLPRCLRYSNDTENFGIVCVNTRRRTIGFEIMSNGTLDTILVHARQVFRSAILMNAAGVLLFHNHPSGDPSPSEADIKVTRDIVRAGQLLKIDVLDHLILGQATPERAKSWTSLRELGFLL
jgi:DNA repair protein RadC